jgi:phosphomannomutase
MSKNKILLKQDMDADLILDAIAFKYKNEKISLIDGVKIDFPKHWVHLRKSNTEPIIRIYTEAQTAEAADALAEDFISQVKTLF